MLKNSMCNPSSKLFRYLSLPALIFWSVGYLFYVPFFLAAQETESIEFNDSFMRFQIDATRYSEGNPVDPGNYRLDIYLNNSWITRQDIRFALPSPTSKVAVPCLNAALLEYIGIDTDILTTQIQKSLEGEGICSSPDKILDTGEVVYDSGQQRIDFNIPQSSLKRRARGYIDPKYWDNGVTAATLKYDYTGYRTNQRDADEQTYHYLSLLGGLNWEEWRLRYRSSLNHNNYEGAQYRNIATYVERAVAPLHSKFTVGDSTTDGQVFDSVSYRGIALASDERMYADSLRGYAPVVRGVAHSNARVVVRQMGQAIYETTVPPGPFTIDDLYPTGQGGDLYVTITEADGSESSFTVAYATIAELLRPGMLRYTLMAGQYRDNSMHEKPSVALGTLRYGFSNTITGYSGVAAAEGYLASSLGLAFNTPIGALAIDVTQAQTKLPEQDEQKGQSLRLTYAKNLTQTNTNLTLASYHYSTNGYYSPSEAMRMRDYLQHGNIQSNDVNDSLTSGLPSHYQYINSLQRRRNQATATITQGLPEGYGSFYASANTQDYWGTEGRDTYYQLGYNNQFKSISYNISASRMRNVASGDWENQVNFSLSVPLGSTHHSPNLNMSYSQGKDTHTVQTGISGTAGENNQYTYGTNISSSYTEGSGENNTFGVNGAWLSPYSTVGANYSKSSHYDQYGASLSGGMVAYSGGVVLAPALGETIAIVEANKAAGARVTNYSGVHLNHNGQAVVPYLNPYRLNAVELDPKGLSTDTELKNTSQNSAPTAGSVALMIFETSSGYSVLLNGTLENGQPLPFGASIKEIDGHDVGYVSQGGQAIVRLKNEKGVLQVIWGDGQEECCRFNYQLTDISPLGKGDYRHLEVICK